jgi:polyhydroxybutyrate depolymerase
MRLQRWVIGIAFIVAAFLALAANSAADVMKWTIAGVQREAIVVTPKKHSASGRAPLVFAFHGHGDNAKDFSEGTKLHDYWPEAIVVYPQGLPTKPDDPEGFGWVYDSTPEGQRDLMFLDAMLTTLRAKFPIDDRRIYATGFSNGGLFSYVLWGSRANTFAAFAVVAGRILPAVHLMEPKPALVIGGQNDTTVPFQQQLNAIKTAHEVNGADYGGTACGQNCMTYTSTKGAPLMTYIHQGEHVYPAGASEMIMKFFQRQALAQ